MIPVSKVHHDSFLVPDVLRLPPQATATVPNAISIVLTHPLNEAEWRLMRDFVYGISPEDLRLRFGRLLDFHDEDTLRRFFDVNAEAGEIVYTLDEHGEIVGVLHHIQISPVEVEIALLVRSDRKRAGIGEALLRMEISRAANRHLQTLRALVLYENTAMLRLARKMGFVSRRITGPAVELELELSLHVGDKREGARPQ